MSDNTLALLKEHNLQQSKYADENTLQGLVSNGFLPYIQIIALQNDLVAQSKAKAGDMHLVQSKSHTSLGTEFNGVVVSYRPKAMQYKPTIVSQFNPNSDSFKDIANRAKTVKNSNCGVGPEFLIWIPDVSMFATFFFGNASGRAEALNVFSLAYGKDETGKQVPNFTPVTFATQFTKNNQGSWFAPTVKRCDLELVLPEFAKAKEVLDVFNNPPEKEVEVAGSSETRDR